MLLLSSMCMVVHGRSQGSLMVRSIDKFPLIFFSIDMLPVAPVAVHIVKAILVMSQSNTLLTTYLLSFGTS